MADLIADARVIQERPTKADVVISGELEVDGEAVKILGRNGIAAAVRGQARKVKKELSKAVRREYRRSGLGIISGDLLSNATQNFIVEIRVRRNRFITVKATWRTPNIDYFFFQLFGLTDIVSVKAHTRRTRGRTQKVRAHSRNVNYKGREFISLDRQGIQGIERVLNKAIADQLEIEVKKPKRKRARPRRPEERVEVTTEIRDIERLRRRPTKFRLRKALRRQGLPAPQARTTAAKIFREAGLTPEVIFALIRAVERGQLAKIVRGFEILQRGIT